ncbi:MAG: hypothetical protein IBX48_04545 [Thiomicrospira sp.]|uniref:hypothetical protein n=1 Tax=Thiomicrospira sp. TaxID=935 RepID=UPI001A0E3A99|nr:hypothetical protein [Thiomicrospira sp.]MBE0493592.1 hypothetical protein [Thiomicrospira sp.]
MKTKLQKMALAGLIGALPMTSVLAGDNSNGFQIAPPPIAHPIFAAGIKDQKFDFNFISMSSDEIEVDLNGFGASYIVREAYSDTFAVSAQAGLFMLNGTMPGLALPFYYQGNWFFPESLSDADVSMMAVPFSANIEMQLIKSDAASLIVFIGPNLGFSVMNMKTSYKVSSTSPTYTNLAQVTSTTAGLQFGMQAGFRVSENVKVSPFFMVSSSSGTANFNYKAGASGVSDTTYSGEIPDITTSSIGMDIIFKEISIGTVLQDIQRSSGGNDEGGLKTAMLRLGYKF